jgi:ketosteroid isomerase-like protein
MAGLVLAGCASDAGEEGMAENVASEEVAASSADEAALEEVRASYVQHYNLHHASVVADLYADSSIALVADGGVHENKPAILAWLEGSMEASPTLDLNAIETREFGDFAVALGEYSVQATPPGGESMTNAGHYLTVFSRMDEGWKIIGVITNFDAERPAEFPYAEMTGETPTDEGTMKSLTDAWAQHFNLGHASVVADLYEENARASFSDSPMYEGRAAVEAALTETLSAGSPQIVIHDVYTMDLGSGYAVDFGWYEMTINAEGQTMERAGAYIVLNHQQPDGTYKIQWHVSNGQPVT